jgi:hypothetical protein|tara:strand:- start:257 stop:436 length:180 start_codon:yes stop_codon:yes gene_type:complete
LGQSLRQYKADEYKSQAFSAHSGKLKKIRDSLAAGTQIWYNLGKAKKILDIETPSGPPE